MTPLVSVIIPVYNGEKYIKGAIDSVLGQDYPNIEIIIVDDGSNDRTREITMSYGDKIKYFHKKNGGVSSSRNLGIKRSNGEFLAFLDCDDIYKKYKISRQMQVILESDDIGFIYNDVDVIDDKLKVLYTLKSEEDFSEKEDLLAYSLYRQVIPAPASILIRKSCIDDSIYYPEQYLNAEDYFFTIRLLMKVKCKYLKESLYLYRRHDNNLTNNHMAQKQCENNIIKDLGLHEVKDIVNNSNFANDYKILLLSKIYYKIDMRKESYEMLKSVELDKRKFEYYFHKGVCEYLLGMYEESRRSFSKATDMDPDRPEAYNNLSCVYIQLGMIYEARLYLTKATKLNKEYMDAKINLLNILEHKYNFKFTERSLRKTLTAY